MAADRNLIQLRTDTNRVLAAPASSLATVRAQIQSPEGITRRERGKIVVVDDERQLATALYRTLRSVGNVVNNQPIDSIDEAFALIEKERPDVVITDLNYDHNNKAGFELAKRVKAAFPGTAVILQSGTTGDLTEQELAIFDAIVLKPWTIYDMENVVKEKLAQPKVIILDDAEIIVQAYSDGLKGIGKVANNQTVNSVPEAMDVFRRENPDIVIVDLCLSKVSEIDPEGFTILKAIKREKPSTIVILTTSAYGNGDSPEIHATIDKAGFDRVFTKGDVNGLVAFVQELNGASKEAA